MSGFSTVAITACTIESKNLATAQNFSDPITNYCNDNDMTVNFFSNQYTW